MSLLAGAVFAVFGGLSIVGGAMGFQRAGSRASLIAGSIAGSLLLTASYLVLSGSVAGGLVVGGVTSLGLAGRFMPAYFKTRKIMPQGLMAGVSALGILVTALRPRLPFVLVSENSWWQWRPARGKLF
jgi:uncharacterized membrane protein (UPF0136 family)